ncbi:MAG TPA: hypothetical protein PKK96_14740 [Anaerolineales bacterium]|nr:hypothetical protein [Anaerolineales bacterium]HNQ94572.1 hypothetical protein [Anaerolineales bacterium]HNS62257.1 hypothetical protein [Anaerolineales bacterium]
MSKRDIGQEILDGIRDIKAYKAGADQAVLLLRCYELRNKNQTCLCSCHNHEQNGTVVEHSPVFDSLRDFVIASHEVAKQSPSRCWGLLRRVKPSSQ